MVATGEMSATQHIASNEAENKGLGNHELKKLIQEVCHILSAKNYHERRRSMNVEGAHHMSKP